ncbi:MAG: 16S rRNA (cytidine(1402)-2'-O)-methyltransferase, partial [Nesterenkonia sp.]|nr:16S rRNA (cytidine(1402)-2'-O)-methyltransferase [Nesterenkonia sp.]
MEHTDARRDSDDGASEPQGLWDAPIVLAATPIGNLSDATDRLRALLRTAEIIACEDTRRTLQLCRALGVRHRARLVSLHEHNEATRAAEVVERAADGARVLVVSDAGMPGISDPGFRLMGAAVEAGVEVTAAPGASAVVTALALSGLASDRFTFAGFLPRRGAERSRLVERLAGEEWTTVLFESPHRTAATLREFADRLGADRAAAVCRELTKKHEEIRRGTLGALARGAEEDPVRGEVVLVLAGAEPSRGLSEEELVGLVLEREASGERLKDAAKA